MNRAMPRVVLAPPPEAVSAFLAGDPLEGAYALGYLTETHFALALDPDGRRTALAVRHDERPQPSLLVFGAPRALVVVLSDPAFATWRAGLRRARQDLWLVGRPEELEGLAGYFYPLERRTLQRHVVDAATLRADPAFRAGARQALGGAPAREERTGGGPAVRQLTGADAAALNRLYGLPGDDSFAAEELGRSAYVGACVIEESGTVTCIAAAGTHVTAPAQGIAAVGNVYTAPTWRDRGWATACLEALCRHHVDQGYRHIVLNVDEQNAPALAVYRRLGFRLHCTYAEVRAAAL
jgi:ribosomal protein S18 acetylase RimI-like enzyme